ncbi:hypothetical protein BGX31_008046 [Mortierella sp. GBA43]|nr:hypothetical protein BGX31_008046 [Mortierella sp. GBA43]
MTSLTQDNYVPNKVVVSVKLGLNSGGRDVDTAVAPSVAASDSTGSKVFAWGMNNNTCNQEDERTKVGETNLFQEPLNSTAGIASIKMSARDGCAPKGEPVCVSSVVVLPSSGNTKGDPVYLSGNILAECGATWYWTTDSFDGFDDNCDRQRVQERCVWMSQTPQEYRTLKEAEILDVPAFLRGNERNFRPSCTSNLRLSFLDGTKAGSSDLLKTTPTFDYVFYNNRDSAKDLCFSTASYGPSFLSLKESMFCDMSTRQKFPLCDSDIAKGCVQRDESLLTFIPGPSSPSSPSLARPMPLRFLGPSNTTGNQTNTALDTSKDPSCQPIQRDAFSVGEKIWAGEHLVSNKRNARLLMDVHGEIFSQFQSDGGASSLTTLGFRTLDERKLLDRPTYYMEVLNDAKICTQVLNTNDRRCLGVSFREDNYTAELYNNGFLYIKKPSGQVLQLDICPVTTHLQVGGKLTNSCLMSSDQSIIVKLTPDGRLRCFRTRWDYLISKGGDTSSSLEILRDGTLRILTPARNDTQVLFNGGLELDGYMISVSNNATLMIHGTNGVKRWEAPLLSMDKP